VTHLCVHMVYLDSFMYFGVYTYSRFDSLLFHDLESENVHDKSEAILQM